MNVHDLVFAAGSGVFAVSLIPAVVKRARMPRSTSVPTAVVLTVFLVNYASMAFWSAFAVEAVTCACWWGLVLLGSPPRERLLGPEERLDWALRESASRRRG